MNAPPPSDPPPDLPPSPAAGRGATRAALTAVVVLVLLVALGAWLRVRAIPGPWGADALGYVERVLQGSDGAPDARSHRHVFLALVRAGLALSDGRPEGASWPGVAASAAVVVLLCAAARRVAGAWTALLPAALWAVLGLDVEEVADVSADCVAALPGAVAALAFVAALGSQRGGRPPVAALCACGAAAGAAVLVKETALFPLMGLVAGAALLGTGPRQRAARAGCVAGAAAAVVAAATAAGFAQDAGIASADAAAAPGRIRWGDPALLSRLVLDVPRMLLTATGAFGFLHLAALPLVARVVVRAARGDALPAAAVASMAAFVVTPVSWDHPALLTAGFPRYVLPLFPLWLTALTDTLAAEPRSRVERWAALAAAAAAVVAGVRAGAWWVVPAGALATSWSAVPEQVRGSVPRAAADALAAASLVAATAVSLTTPLARTAPDPIWTAWPALAGGGRIHADRLTGRRLAVAARTAPGADASRIALLDGPSSPALAPGDWLLVRDDTPAAAACRALAASGALRTAGVRLGATLAFRR